MREVRRLLAGPRGGRRPVNFLDLEGRRIRLCREKARDFWERTLRDLPEGAPWGRLYLHVPFCTSACHFCQYFALELKSKAQLDEHVELLLSRMRWYAPAFRRVRFDSLYWGGGTASLLTAAHLRTLFAEMGRSFRFTEDSPRTFECNPASVTAEKIRVMTANGINRISFGVQSTDPKMLAHMERSYQTPAVLRSAVEAARAGSGRGVFLNLDMVIGTRPDTAETVLADFERLAALRPDTIALYPVQPTADYLRREYGGDAARQRREVDRKAEAFFAAVGPAAERLGYYLPAGASPRLLESDSWRFVSKEARGGPPPRLIRATRNCLGLGTQAQSFAHGACHWTEREDGGVEGVTYRDVREQKVAHVARELVRKRVSLAFYRRVFGTDLLKDFPAACRLLRRHGVAQVKDGALALKPMSMQDRRLYALLFTAPA